jgi:hypothetical protein
MTAAEAVKKTPPKVDSMTDLRRKFRDFGGVIEDKDTDNTNRQNTGKLTPFIPSVFVS